MRNFVVSIDGKRSASLSSGQSIVLRLSGRESYIQVSMWPYRSARLPICGQHTEIDLYVGFFHRNLIESFLPTALKILSTSEYESFKKGVNVLPQLSRCQVITTIILGIMAGIILILSASSLSADWSVPVLLLGIGAILGGLAVVYFNRKSSKSSFPYHKPILDAVGLFLLMFLVETYSKYFYIACLTALALISLAIVNYMRADMKNSS